MDRLTELFADKPISYAGAGLSYAGDASGNAVLVPESPLRIQRNVVDSDATSGGSHPFKCPAAASTSSVVSGGSVNGQSATNLTLNISSSGTRYVYLDVTMTQDVSSDGYVLGFSGGHTNITAALATGSSVPADSSTHLYRQVAKYVDGVKTEQNIISSMEVVIRDDGSGSSTANAIWGQS